MTVLSSTAAGGDIYLRIDDEGIYNFTDVPESQDYKIFIREPKKKRSRKTTTKYDSYIKDAALKHDVPFHLLKAVMKAESGFDPKAVSNKGAKGLMQIMPGNFKKLDIKDPFDPMENTMAGAKYLRELLNRYKGEERLALAAYNAGPESVDRHKSVPPIKETREYVSRVMSYYHLLRK